MNSFNEMLLGTGPFYALNKSWNQLLSKILTRINAGHHLTTEAQQFAACTASPEIFKV